MRTVSIASVVLCSMAWLGCAESSRLHEAVSAPDAGVEAPYLVLQPVRLEPTMSEYPIPPSPCSWYVGLGGAVAHPALRVVLVRDGEIVADVTAPCEDDAVVVGRVEPGTYQLAAIAMTDPAVEDHLWVSMTGKSLLATSYGLSGCDSRLNPLTCQPFEVTVDSAAPTYLPLDLRCDEELANRWDTTCGWCNPWEPTCS